MQNMAVFQLNLYITKQGDMEMIYYDHFSKQMTSYRTKAHKANINKNIGTAIRM